MAKISYEYVDLRGAPWNVTLTYGEGAPDVYDADSPAYRSAGKFSASTHDGLVSKIDGYVALHNRDAIDPTSTVYSQSPIKDKNDSEWGTTFVDGPVTGYFANQWGTMVGPASGDKDHLIAMVNKYLTRREAADVASLTPTNYTTSNDPVALLRLSDLLSAAAIGFPSPMVNDIRSRAAFFASNPAATASAYSTTSGKSKSSNTSVLALLALGVGALLVTRSR